MKTLIDAPRVDAAVHCYAIARRATPGTVDADAAEHAAGLVLSRRRPIKERRHMIADAIRDGRRTMLRARDGRRIAETSVGRLAAQNIRTGGAGPHQAPDNPVDSVLAHELLNVLRERSEQLGAPAPRVLAGLLVEETELETAAATQTSRSTVTRIRRQLRACAREAGYQPQPPHAALTTDHS